MAVIKRYLANEQAQVKAAAGELLESAEELLAGRFEARSWSADSAARAR